MARRPPAPEHLRWLRDNGHQLGILTGTDYRVLAAIDACWQALPYVDRNEDVFAAVRALLPSMQEKCWPLARDLIARSLDWGDRERIWPKVCAEATLKLVESAEPCVRAGDHEAGTTCSRCGHYEPKEEVESSPR